MRSTRFSLLVGVMIGCCLLLAVEVLAAVMVIRRYVPEALSFAANTKPEDDLFASRPKAGIQIPVLAANHIFCHNKVVTNRLVVRGVDMRLLSENTLGMLVSKGLLEKEEVRKIYAVSRASLGPLEESEKDRAQSGEDKK